MADVPRPPGKGFDLSAKMGLLPVWAWAVLGVAVGYYLYKKMQTSTSAGTTAATAPSSADTATTQPYYTLGGGTGATGTATGAGATTANTAPQTLGEWESTAASGAIAAGYNPSQVETALANFGSGQPVDSTGESILNWALSQYGSPPSGVMPVLTSTGAGTSPAGTGTLPLPYNPGGLNAAPIPSAGPAAPASQYSQIGTPSAGSELAAAGFNEYELVPGTSTYVQVTQGTKRLPAWSSFSPGESSLYYQPAQTPAA